MEFPDNSTYEASLGEPDLFSRQDNIIPLIELGAASEIQANQTHVYSIPDSLKNSPLSLSTCSLPNVTSDSLTLIAGGVEYSGKGGLVLLTNSDFSTVSVRAPAGSGTWTYELGIGASTSVSVDMQNTDLFYVDSDFANALLVTTPLSNITDDLAQFANLKGWGSTSPNVSLETLQVSVFPYRSDMLQNGLYQSYCAMSRGPLMNQHNMDLSYTKRGAKHQDRAQYLLPGLNKSSEYTAFLSYSNPNLNQSAPAGVLGGIMLGPAIFSTKESTSCQLVYNMSFCSEMAFAVPGNASAFTVPELTAFYDNMAQSRYENFAKSLQQESCQGPLDDQYSVLRSCKDCDASYRNWLCAITVPRCADWTLNDTYLRPRPQGHSRNPDINKYIDPGNYNEVLPCKQLCYNLVRDCPATLGFSCPNKHLINMSYGSMSDDGFITCSYPGAVYFENYALTLAPSWILAVVLLFTVLL